jgi:phosphoribosyl 1,2-cyclic phosphodiesterase
MTPGTRLAARDPHYPSLREFQTEVPVVIGDLEVRPYTVPHDAREPSQFVFHDGARRLALLTDAGHVSPHIMATLDGVDGLLIESNHDEALLATGPYPQALKRRVGGDYGHLSNAAATRLLKAIDRSHLQHVIGMHLSERNNTPALARQALAEGLGCTPEETVLATQADGFGWRELR